MPETPRLQDLPKQGDVYGNPNPGHRVDVIHAAVLVYPDGSEGLMSRYTFDEQGEPTGRVTFVASVPKLVPTLKQKLAHVELPQGARVEWREYRRTDRDGGRR